MASLASVALPKSVHQILKQQRRAHPRIGSHEASSIQAPVDFAAANELLAARTATAIPFP